MGPKMQEIEVKFTVEDSFVTAALPYNKAEYQKVGESSNNESERSEDRSVEPSVSENLEEDTNPVRISTRARYSYELDRYNKHAMLIFEGNSSDAGFSFDDEDGDQGDDVSGKFKQTFEKFHFEVTIYRDLNDDEIASTCERFFQRDFTEYGCVAVMMLPKTRDGIVETYHTPKSEFGVMRYMSDLMPPTLQDKPKIYIVQTEGYYVIPRARVWSTLPQDNLEFRLCVPIVSAPDIRGRRSKVCCLLEFIHEKISNLGDQVDLQTLLSDSTNEFIRTTQLFDFPLPGFYSSLTKELRFVRKPES
ncbi:unnamed protein product [Spodoptera littoralis]|uniref:Peptidase C14 caspase domain-containing protein n=1 Tax=Spodoptera littoralis TaxID=7109 RepID=A0A9P0I227_SPOLI|nr:unnamed protein product [Spodoptera littoralis]CAH1638006.1 unnamed protein product [Spodoptera littoralis]